MDVHTVLAQLEKLHEHLKKEFSLELTCMGSMPSWRKLCFQNKFIGAVRITLMLFPEFEDSIQTWCDSVGSVTE
jgi:hypothetical protein